MSFQETPVSHAKDEFVRIAIVTEGPTEEQFVTDFLAPYLQQASGGRIYAQGMKVKTGYAASGRPATGGGGWYAKTGLCYNTFIRDLLAQPQWQVVTTMIDYYGFPKDFIQKAGLENPGCEELENQLRDAYKTGVRQGKWVPFVVKHEFETLVIAGALHGTSSVFSEDDVAVMREWKQSALGVEEINDSEQTAPSKRLVALKARSTVPYQKLVDSSAVFAAARFTDVLGECPHFANWVACLLALAE